jgi:hypothetical protein
MLAALLKEAGLPPRRGQLLGCLPTLSRGGVSKLLASHGLLHSAAHFSPEELKLEPDWLELVEEIMTGQKGLCDKLRRELADRDHVLMAIECKEEEARLLLKDLWNLGAECLCYWDEWRVHFDYVAHSRGTNELPLAPQGTATDNLFR